MHQLAKSWAFHIELSAQESDFFVNFILLFSL